jgi:hypothetical protein
LFCASGGTVRLARSTKFRSKTLLLPFVSLTSVVGPLAQPSASLAVGTG